MKRNTLTTAVLAGLTGVAGMAGVANAVNVNPDGLGQVLIYPYYTARENNDTLISIVNTSNRGKAVKIRFIEALNSKEVLDFNIYMSPFDVWVAAITEDEETETPGVLIPDTTCTVPYLQGGETEEVGGVIQAKPKFQEFLNYAYTGDGGGNDIERAASGYIEVVEMGTFFEALENEPLLGEYAADDDNPTQAELIAYFEDYVPWAINHTPNADGVSVPNDCGALVAAWTENRADDLPLWLAGRFSSTGDNFDLAFETGANADALRGGLLGAGSVVNPESGFLVSYNATAIDAFFSSVNEVAISGDGTLHKEPGNVLPGLGDGNELVSNIFDNGELVRLDWGTPANATTVDGYNGGAVASVAPINAVLTKDMIMNEYLITPGLNAKTEWVVTFPTKRFHVNSSTVIPPFTKTWDSSTGGACEQFEFVTPTTWADYLDNDGSRFWDREEQPGPDPTNASGPIVSPRPPATTTTREVFQMCREANVLRFASDEAVATTEVFGEPSRSASLTYTNVQLPEGFTEGWVRLNLTDYPVGTSGFGERLSQVAARLDASGAVQGPFVVEGLPVVGFAATAIVNTNAQDGVLANYGASFQHRGTRSVTASR